MAVLDTSFLIDLLRNKKEAFSLRNELDSLEPTLYATAPSIMELWDGALFSAIPQREKEKVEQLLRAIDILPLDSRGAKRAAEIGFALSKKGEIIQDEDLMIAGIALTNGEMVVTRDEHFTRIPGLKVLKY